MDDLITNSDEEDNMWRSGKHEIDFDQVIVPAKGQLISKCLFGVIVWTKIPTNFIPGFLPQPLKRGQIKKVV